MTDVMAICRRLLQPGHGRVETQARPLIRVVGLALILVSIAAAGAWAVSHQASALPEILQLKVENVRLSEALLGRDLDRCLASINYPARLQELQAKWAAIEPDIVAALGGDPGTDKLDRATVTLVPKADR